MFNVLDDDFRVLINLFFDWLEKSFLFAVISILKSTAEILVDQFLV